MTTAVRDRRGEFTPPEQGARAKAQGYRCSACLATATVGVTVHVQHRTWCTIGARLDRMRKARRAA